MYSRRKSKTFRSTRRSGANWDLCDLSICKKASRESVTKPRYDPSAYKSVKSTSHSPGFPASLLFLSHRICRSSSQLSPGPQSLFSSLYILSRQDEPLLMLRTNKQKPYSSPGHTPLLTSTPTFIPNVRLLKQNMPQIKPLICRTSCSQTRSSSSLRGLKAPAATCVSGPEIWKSFSASPSP